MKHIKTYEAAWTKNMKVGNIYKILSYMNGDAEFKHNIPIGKITKMGEYEYDYSVGIKTFLVDGTEHNLRINKGALLKKATPEEIKEFEDFEIKNTANNFNI